jgi:hypothetical protein
MASPAAQDAYTDLLLRIESAYRQIEALRAEPPSPKRDSALKLLEAAHSGAILALRQLDK